MSTTPTTPQWHPQVSEACWLNHNDALGTKSAVVVLNIYRGGNAKVWDESSHCEKECAIANLSPRTPQWAIEAAKEIVFDEGNITRNLDARRRHFAEIIAMHAPPLSPSAPTDEAKLREQVMDAVLTYIHAAYFNGGVRNPMFDANLLTDRILTALAPPVAGATPAKDAAITSAIHRSE